MGFKSSQNGKKRGRAHEETPPEYILEKGLRKVKPYIYVYETFAKERWLGRTLFSVFADEFRSKGPEFIKTAIEAGRMQLNLKTVPLDEVIGNGDLISHKVHRHEPPVTNLPIEVVHASKDMLAISKPGGISIHPSGNYNHNTVTRVLMHEGWATDGSDSCRLEPGFSLKPCNRLDRLTSGLVLIALNRETAVAIQKEFVSRTIKKTYICRVKGEFPEGEIVCDQPILSIAFKPAINIVSPKGKACLTKFTRLHFNGRTSILRCEPETGRTHQIRVHLQHLGFPIANDPIYTRSEINTISLNPTALEGEDFPEGCESLGLTAGVQGAATKTTATSNTTSHVLSSRLKETTGGQERKDADGEGDEESSGVSNISLTTSVAPDHETHLQEVEGGCSDCKLTRMDPLPEQLYIYLHAYKYVGQGWSYQTEMPFWAREDYDDSFLPERFWRHNGKWDGKVLGEVLEE